MPTLKRVIEPILITLMVLFCVYFLFFHARFFNIEDSSTARRALLIVSGTDHTWGFTMAYKIVGTVFRLWSESIFHLRVTGIVVLCIGALVFAVIARRRLESGQRSDLLNLAILFLGGLGIYAYISNGIIEYNHFQTLCALLLCSTVIVFPKAELHFKHFLFLGALFGFYLAVNLPSGSISILGYGVFRFFTISSLRDWSKEYLKLCIFTAITFLIMHLGFGGLEFSQLNPGAVYQALAIKELGGTRFAPSNFLYVVLRSIYFSIELFGVIVICLGAFWVGRLSGRLSIGLRRCVFSVPLLWLILATIGTYNGIESFHTPDGWDFSPMFFLGKLVWYGYATMLPIFVFFSLYFGLHWVKTLSGELRSQILFLIFIVLSGCFGSGQRIVHKALMYEWCLIYIFLLLSLQTADKHLRLSRYYLLAMLVFQISVLQFVPIAVSGGAKSYSHSLDSFPRGKGMLVQEGFFNWISSLSEGLKKNGIKDREQILSNDTVAVYLLGLNQATEISPIECCRFGLLKTQVVSRAKKSKIEHSRLLKILGPPNLPMMLEEQDKKFELLLRKNSFIEFEQLDRQNGARSILFLKPS